MIGVIVYSTKCPSIFQMWRDQSSQLRRKEEDSLRMCSLSGNKVRENCNNISEPSSQPQLETYKKPRDKTPVARHNVNFEQVVEQE